MPSKEVLFPRYTGRAYNWRARGRDTPIFEYRLGIPVDPNPHLSGESGTGGFPSPIRAVVRILQCVLLRR
ncbi:MAG: hypothetical protein ACFFE8_17260 [Candidatus Heimdallarchaeota archaeon]